MDESDGVFDFADVLDEDNGGLCFECEPNSDDGLYFSDFRDDHDESSDASTNDVLGDDFDSNDDSGISFIPSENDEDVEDDLSGFFDIEEDEDEDEDKDDDDMATEDAMYFTPKQVHDDDVPFCDNTFPPINNFNPPSSFTMQLQLNHLFNQNKGSLKMYDETINIIQGYINSLGINGAAKLLPRETFLS